MRNLSLVVPTLLLLALPARADVAPAGDGARTPLGAPAAASQGSSDAKHRAVTAKDESIYVVQERSYSKSGKFELTPMFFTALNPKFVGYLGAAVAGAYHLRENLAIEVLSSIPYGMYTYYSNLVAEVYNYEGLTPEDVDLKRMTYFGGASLQFSAVYGKVRFYDWLMDYDFYVSAGFGYARTLETCNPERDEGCSDKKEIGRGFMAPREAIDRHKLAGNLGGGARFFFADALGVRFEVRDVTYADRARVNNTTSTDIRNNLLFFLGLSLMI
jgi:outer membrane beta-barrel protein